jgi:hypothetical protein
MTVSSDNDEFLFAMGFTKRNRTRKCCMYGGEDEERSAEDFAGDKSSDSGVDLTGDLVGVFIGVRIVLRIFGDFRGDTGVCSTALPMNR